MPARQWFRLGPPLPRTRRWSGIAAARKNILRAAGEYCWLSVTSNLLSCFLIITNLSACADKIQCQLVPSRSLRAVLIGDCMAMRLGNQALDPLGVQSLPSGAMHPRNRSSALGVECNPDVISPAAEGRRTGSLWHPCRPVGHREIGNHFEQEITPQPDLDLLVALKPQGTGPDSLVHGAGAQPPQFRMWQTTYSGTIQPCCRGPDKFWIR
jgi:hypothetical protein